MATDAGTAFVAVKPDTSGFSSALSAGLQQQSSGLKSAAKSIAKTIGLAFGAREAFKFAEDSVKAFAESEAAIADLNSAIQRTPDLLGETTAAFEDQAHALQNLTGFQDEEILKADTVLTRFKLTGDQIRDLIPLVLDYARATKTDAVSAATSIGKALLGNTRALKTLGIDGFVPTGNRAKDLAAIMGQLEDKVGGTAETFGTTLAGKMEIASAKFDDFKESIGQFLGSGLLLLSGDIKGAAGLWTELGGATDEATQHFADIAEAMGAADAALLGVTMAQIQPTLDWVDALAAAATATGAVQTAAEQAAFAEDGLADAQRALNDALRDGWVLANEAAGGLVGLFAADVDATRAKREFMAAQKTVNDLVAKGKKGTQEYRDAVQARTDAELGSIQSQQNLEGQAQSLYAEFRKGNVTLAEADARLRAQAKSAGLSAAQTNALVGKVNDLYAADSRIPSDVRTNFLANGLSGNLADLAKYNQYLASLDGKQVYITVHTNYIETGAVPHGGIQ